MAAAIVDAFDEHPSNLAGPPRLSFRRGHPPAVPPAGHRPPRITPPVDADPILADEPDKQTAPTAVNAPGFRRYILTGPRICPRSRGSGMSVAGRPRSRVESG